MDGRQQWFQGCNNVTYLSIGTILVISPLNYIWCKKSTFKKILKKFFWGRERGSLVYVGISVSSKPAILLFKIVVFLFFEYTSKNGEKGVTVSKYEIRVKIWPNFFCKICWVRKLLWRMVYGRTSRVIWISSPVRTWDTINKGFSIQTFNL